jgi:hypothetical protein
MNEQQKKDLENEKNKNNPNYNENDKKTKKKDKNKDKEIIELDYKLCDFPLPYSEQRLVENWYEFNDSTVVPI